MSEQDRLTQAIELAKAGNREEAQKIVAQVLLANTNNVHAWIVMAQIADNPRRALQCWQQAARLKPGDPRIMRKIARLKGEPLSPVTAQTRSPAVRPGRPTAPSKGKMLRPLLFGGAIALVLVISGVALAIARMEAQSGSDQPAALIPEAASATVQQNSLTDMPVPDTATTNESTSLSTSTQAALEESKRPTAVTVTSTGTPTLAGTPTSTATLSDTSEPAATAEPPTAAQPSGPIEAGIYLVGEELPPGIYRGQAADDSSSDDSSSDDGSSDDSSSCYWMRLDTASPIAERENYGQFYVEVQSTDYAFETTCDLLPLALAPPNPGGSPQSVPPGMYLIGRDIQTGTYQGQAEIDSCYWELLSDVSGELDSLVNSDYEDGQFVIEVVEEDFALVTTCQLEKVGS